MKLDIGCGRGKKPGFVGIDINRDSDADIVASAWRLPIRDATISEVVCYHLVEHLYPDGARQLFAEIFRVLEYGGEARLKVDRDWSRRRLLGKDPEHKYRYSANEIKGMVSRFSFKKVERRIYLFNYRLRTKIFVELRK